MRSSLIVIILLVVFSCGSTESLSKPKITKELSLKELKQRNLVPTSYPYKKNYTRIMSYLFNNNRNNFIEIKGDFKNVKYGNDSAYNIMVGYWEKYGQYTTSLIVMVRTSDNSKESIKNKMVKVSSSRFGDLLEVPTKTTQSYQDYPPVLFIRKIDIPSKDNIIDMLKEDKITITIDDESYEFLNPEIQ